ncbi:MAG: Integral rane protein [Chloroflexi bacterium]|nr:Integral rane protein [Chloroflexota bacterium]
MATGQLLCGAVELALVTPFLTRVPSTLPAHVAASVMALGVFGTGIAFILNYGLIRVVGATLASTVTYVIPLFSTLEGVILLGEPVTWYEPAGAVIVVLGVAICQGRLRIIPHRELH